MSYGWAYALMEMLVDPVLLEWVPDYIVEQYRRWNPYFTESLDAARSGRPQSNRRFLRRVRRRMEAKHKARQQEEVKTPDVAAVSSESESKGSDSDGSAAHDDAARLEQQAMQAVVNDTLPSFGGDGPDEASGNSAEWAKPNAEEALSAAGPGEVLPERVKATTHGDPSDVCGEVNPQGYDWAARSVVPLMHARALQELWQKWCGQDVFTADDLRGAVEDDPGLEPPGKEEALDPWQAFARDIIAGKGKETSAGPRRLFMTGTAGTGKSRTIKAAVSARNFRSVQSKFGAKHKRRSCVLAAPTGCASFQLEKEPRLSIGPSGCLLASVVRSRTGTAKRLLADRLA